MKIWNIMLVVSLLFLSGCSSIHGKLIQEEKKSFSNDVEFSFTVRDDARHRVNAVFDYIKPRYTSNVRYPGMIETPLRDQSPIQRL